MFSPPPPTPEMAEALGLNRWGVYDAKNKFSQLLRAAGQQGPQTIWRHKEAVAVVLSAKSYQRMQRIVDMVRAEMKKDASAAGG